MSDKYIEYIPNRVRSVGEFLARELQARNIKKQDFAIRCGRTPKLISEIISGEAPLIAETAIQFERVLGIEASFWLNMESNYQLAKKKKVDQENWAHKGDWTKKFPLTELIKRSYLSSNTTTSEMVGQILRFFGTASIEACEKLIGQTLSEVKYRRDDKHSDDHYSELTWLRMGRIIADEISCLPYNASLFRSTLNEIRELTNLPLVEFLPILQKKCAACGVAIVVVSELKNTHTSGASRWISKDKAIIQLSNRGKWNDVFWFNFFHESCHILNHSKKTIFWDYDSKSNNQSELAPDVKLEKEADEFAAEILVPSERYFEYFKRYEKKGRFSIKNIEEYSKKIGIAPGILLGQFQNNGKFTYKTSHNSKLKLRLEIPG